MTGAKVSIISPCYNGESYLEYFLESLLEQDYTKEVEFFFVDDGSTDKTKEIFLNYQPKFIQKGWQVEYIYQKNQGQAAALNEGLKRFSGDYLLWPDSDDIMYPNQISEKVKFMEENPQYGLAYCIIDVVKYSNREKILYKDMRGKNADNAFKNIMNDEFVMWPPIGVIARASTFLKANPKRIIPTGNGGQNCQMQLPILYSAKCGFIDKSLGKYVIRDNSHSRSCKNIFKRRYELAKIWILTILSLNNASRFEKLKLILWTIYVNIKKIFNHYFSRIYSASSKKQGNKIRKTINIFGIKITYKIPA